MKTIYDLPDLEAEGPAPEWSHKGPPLSYAFFCPQHCHEIWARRKVHWSVNQSNTCLVFTVPCPNAKPVGVSPAGSIWTVLTSEDKRVLPFEVLQRELTIHLDYVEKLNDNHPGN